MSWNDIEDIAIALYEAHPDIEPLTVRSTDLHKMVTTLAGFEDGPHRSNEVKLEAGHPDRMVRGVERQSIIRAVTG